MYGLHSAPHSEGASRIHMRAIMRPEPYTRLYARWNAELVARGVSGREFAVFAALTQYKVEELPDGTGRAWRPKEDIAASLGMTPNAVKAAMRGLKDKGCIRPLGPAHRGKAQVYQVMPDCPVFTEGKGCPADTPKKGKRGAPQPPKGCAPDTPIRRKEGVSPSYGRANPRC